jgi:aldehyde dehydrogenase (NAD+)
MTAEALRIGHDTDPGEGGLKDAALLIGADWVDRTSAGSVQHINAATGRVQAKVALAGADEVDAAVTAAGEAWPAWRDMPCSQRRRILARIEQAIEDHTEELTRITVLEMGAAWRFAQLNPGVAANWFGYYSGWADKIESRVIPPAPAVGFNYTLAEPYGVVGIITAWNGPLISVGMKVAPALAAGNCVVLKPSELAPFSSLRFAELALEAGLPPGVLNVVPGGPQAGDSIVRDPRVGKVSFTGGVETARKIMTAATETVKPLTLELGGKSANIFMADADLDTSLPVAAMMSVMVLAGQGCGCGSRLLVADEIHDEVVERLKAILDASPIGDPLDPATVIGPVVNAAACDRILGIIQRAQDEGSGTLAHGGSRLGGPLADGFFLEPTVFTDVPPTSSLAQNEVFGPVLSVMRFSDADEAIRLANSTSYGLAAYINSRDLNTVHTMARRLEAGTVWVNGFSGLPPGTPFGGYKQSGYGREGGEAGIHEFLQTKNVFIGMPS